MGQNVEWEAIIPQEKSWCRSEMLTDVLWLGKEKGGRYVQPGQNLHSVTQQGK